NVGVAPGKYDIYVEADPGAHVTSDSGVSSPCHFVPRLFREVAAATKTCLPSSSPKLLDVKVQWPAGSAGVNSLEGWTADIVHPTTGQILSDRKVVPAGGTVVLAYTDVTVFSATAPYEDSGQDLVRLTPPKDVTGPIVQLVRSGLQALTGPDHAVTPPIGPFPA